jgi:hypothetical protein
MARRAGVAWSKFTSVSVSVNVFESMGIYPFNRNKVPKYFFSISGTSENITTMETALLVMALV